MRRLLLPVVLALVVLSGCSGDDDPEPRIAPSGSSSAAAPAPSPTPTGPVEPTLPPEAAGDDAAAAEAFVRYFWEVGDYAQVSGDIAALEAAATSSCDNCRAGSDYLKDLFSQGARIEGGGTEVTVTGSREYAAGPVSGFEVTATVKNKRQVVDWPEPKEDEVYAASVIKTRFLVERREGGFGIGFWESLS